MEGNRMEHPLEGENKLVVHTKNGVGNPFDLDLTNRAYNFKRNGDLLPQDKLNQYVMNSEVEEILLEAVIKE